MSTEELTKEIKELLALGCEGEYWDFKSDYTDVKEDKLIDIICMANNLCNRDAYIIFGAADNGEIIGIENTKAHRATTADLIKFLRERSFAGDNIPKVEVKTLTMQDHEIDVWIVYNSRKTPYYLAEEYNPSHDIKKSVRAGAIYARTSDMNTPRKETANDAVTEYLWKKRFGYDIKPHERYAILLDDYMGWSDTNWDTVKYQYYKEYPEYKISVGESDRGYETLRFFYDDPTMYYAEMHMDYYGTTLYETELWYMDCGRCIIPKPVHKSLGMEYLYLYFIQNSIDGKLLTLITHGKGKCQNRSGLDVPVLIFTNEQEQSNFESYFIHAEKDGVRENLKQNAIMQHIICEEEAELNGKPMCGVLEYAIVYEIYKQWCKSEVR